MLISHKDQRITNVKNHILLLKKFNRYFYYLSPRYSHNYDEINDEFIDISKNDMIVLVKSIISYNKQTTVDSGNLNSCITSDYLEYQHAIKTINNILSGYTPDELLHLLFDEMIPIKNNSYDTNLLVEELIGVLTYDIFLEELFENNRLLIMLFAKGGAEKIITRRQNWYKRKLTFLTTKG